MIEIRWPHSALAVLGVENPKKIFWSSKKSDFQSILDVRVDWYQVN